MLWNGQTGGMDTKWNGEGGVCNPKIVGIEAEASGLLRLRFEDPKDEICIMLATRIARIVAVPRSVLPATVVFLHGYAFEIPQARLHRDSLGS